MENGNFSAFEAPLGVRATYAVHLILVGKLVGDFLLVKFNFFRYVLSFRHNSRI